MNFVFHHIWDNPEPIDELIFFKMVITPPTSIGFDFPIGLPSSVPYLADMGNLSGRFSFGGAIGHLQQISVIEHVSLGVPEKGTIIPLPTLLHFV